MQRVSSFEMYFCLSANLEDLNLETIRDLKKI